MEELVAANLKGKEGTLIIGGWSNIHNEPIITSCIQVNGKLYIIDVGTTKSQQNFYRQNAVKLLKLRKKNMTVTLKALFLIMPKIWKR